MVIAVCFGDVNYGSKILEYFGKWDTVWIYIRPPGGVFFNLKFCFTWIWNSAFSCQLSQQHTKGPDVRFDSETSVQGCLRCRPFDRELCPCVTVGGEQNVSQQRQQSNNQTRRKTLPCLAVYSLSSMSLARPKSATLHTRLSPTRMLAARRSLWT